MKNLYLILLAGIFALCIFACKRPNAVKPTHANGPKSDTSTTLIANTELVGDWNVVTDTMHRDSVPWLKGGSIMYYGTAKDHFIFTKYANLYVNIALNGWIDTAIYDISGSDTLRWINSYLKQGVATIIGPSSQGAFKIISITPHSLIIRTSGISPDGYEYQQITFKK